MWETTVNGRVLHFHLAGINNQNFIMRDEETGSWWQQVSGEAIAGPLKGQRLRAVDHDELTFALWKQEQKNGRVLKPDPKIAQSDYPSADWEQRMARVPVASRNSDQTLPQRTLVVGVSNGRAARAYPIETLARQSPIIDDVGGTPIVVVLATDGKSARAFERVVNGRKLEFFSKKGTPQLILVDAETGSEWDFTGKATSGEMIGQQLKKVPVLLDYWFDWKTYHPGTSVYNLN